MPQHRNLNLKKFIDSIPESLLQEYFILKFGDEAQLPIQQFDFETIQEFLNTCTDIDLVATITEDFTQMNDICENVMNIIVQAIDKYAIMTPKNTKREEVAIDLFLHHYDAFEYAYDRFCLFKSSSKMSMHTIQSNNFEVTEERLTRFETALSGYYADLAKGQECQVRHHQEKGESIIVIIHGTYNRSMSVWEDGRIETKFFRPAYEDILVYNSESSSLAIKARIEKDRQKYIDAFTRIILEDDSLEQVDRDSTYTLTPLQDGTFSFNGNEQIVSITLREIQLRYGGMTSPELTLKSDDIMETLKGNSVGINMNAGEIVRAKFRFRIEHKRKGRNISFVIKPPNVTDLNSKKYSEIISEYLKNNGIKLI